MATVIYAVLDADLAHLTLSNAGHPPPVIATNDQPARLIEAKPDLPIGAYPDAGRHHTHVPVPPEACLFLYTDGLVERHDRSIIDGMNRLTATLACGPAETMCTTAMTQLFDGQPANDDTAMLAIRRTRTRHRPA
jgi:sigma-B regulation protein RsbU (phosphoserine phosphatase)